MDIRELAADDDLAAFHSGTDALDTWLRTRALENRRRGFGTTYVAVEGSAVLGFVSTSAAEIERARVKRGQGPERWSALLIGRMAVSKDHHKRGIGKRLMAHAFAVADAQYRLSGCAAVVVDAKPESVDYYRQFGFKDLLVLPSDQPKPDAATIKMYVPIKTVHDAIGSATSDTAAS